MTFKGHNFIKITGCDIPQRFWDVKLLTLQEYNNLNEKDKKDFSLIEEKHTKLLHQHFGK